MDGQHWAPAKEVEAAIRKNERERCRDRINELIDSLNRVATSRSWREARLSGLMAARSAVMRDF